MGVYLFNILSLPIYKILIKNRKIFCIIVSFQMFLILALRDVTLGVDLSNYMGGFQYISTLSFSEMLSRLNILQVADLVYPYSYESGYVVLNWIVASIGLDFHGFLVVCAAINMFSFGTFIYRYSYKPALSFTLFTALGMYTYCFGIIRQSLAVSIVLWSIPYLLKNEKVKYIGVIILAFLFHRTAILFLPFVWLINVKITRELFKKFFLLWTCILIAVPILYDYIIVPLLNAFGVGYIGSGFQLNNLFLLMVIIVFIIYLFIDFSIFNDAENKISCWGLLLAVVLEILCLNNETMARSVEYYFLFAIILVPNVIRTYKNKSTRISADIVVYFLMVLFLVYTLSGSVIVPYRMY